MHVMLRPGEVQIELGKRAMLKGVPGISGVKVYAMSTRCKTNEGDSGSAAG